MVASSRSSQSFFWYHLTFLIWREPQKIADMLKRTEVKALHLKSVLVACYCHPWKRHNLIESLLLNNIFYFCFLIFLDVTEPYFFESPIGNRNWFELSINRKFPKMRVRGMRTLNCLSCISFSKRNVLFSHLILFQCCSVSLNTPKRTWRIPTCFVA